ncbi:MAG: hypothetical protein GY726_10355, partial [Proteobacteria bacterium]|nr:hypothetical protein [Pseudomonadota bacterium]
MWISVIKSGFKKNKLRSFPVLAAICLALLVAPTAALAIEFQVPGSETTLNVGGYVKLDVIYNDVSVGDDRQENIEYSPGSVPLNDTTDGEENELTFNARESRMWIKTTTPTDMGPLKTHFEADFDTTES